MEPTAFAPPPVMSLHNAFGSGNMFEAPQLPSVPQPRMPGRTPKRRRGAGGDGPQPPLLPSLSGMQKANRRKAKKYYKGRHGPRGGRSVPPAPANTNSFLLGTGTTPVATSSNLNNVHTKFHSRTPNPLNPGTSWKNAPLGPDAEHLLGAIDTYGTNIGLIRRNDDAGADSFSDNTDSDPEDAIGYELHMHERQQQEARGEEQLPQQARLRLEEQAAYIADLEEQNMTLREKLFLLEEQLREAQPRERSASPSPSSSGAAASQL